MGVLRVAASLLTALTLAACGEGTLVPLTAEANPSLPQISLELAGHTRAVHLRTFGDPANPVLLVLHGSLGDHRSHLLWEALADRYFVVMWDQRGNGLSERITRDEYTWDSVVDEIAAIKARYSPDRPVTLLGHSFGAMYSALYMSRHPEQVRQAALLEPGGLNGQIFSDTYADIISIDLRDPGMNAMFWQNEVLGAADHEEIDYRALMILLNGKQTRYYCDPDAPPPMPVWRPGGYIEYVRGVRMQEHASGGAMFDFDFAAGLKTFAPHVLLVAGTCSALGPAFQQAHHVPLFRSAEVVTIEDVGHRLHVEKPDAVLAAVRGYLAEYQP